MKHAKTADEAFKMETQLSEPWGWIQWKGTDVCLDVHCICGHLGHVDGDFAYTIRCSKCNQVYSISGNVELIAIDERDDDRDLLAE